MSNTLYQYQHSEFNLNEAGSSVLLLQLAADHFSAAILKAGKLMVWLKDLPLSELLNPIELNGLFNLQYAQVVVGVASPKFTLWPSAVFEPAQAAAIARLLNVSADESVLHDQLNEQNLAVYTTPKQITEALTRYGWENQAVFHPKGWIKAIGSDEPAAQTLYLNIDKNQVEVLYLNEGKIRLYNNFSFEHPDELAYYAVLAAQELALDSKTTHVKVSGSVLPGDANISRLAEFFLSAGILNLKVIDLPANVPAASILALSALSLCASLAEA